MQLVCPHCAARYDIADGTIGANGRKVRCRACGTSWFEPGAGAASPPPAPAPESAPVTPPPPIALPGAATIAGAADPAPLPAAAGRVHHRSLWLVAALAAAVLALGAAIALILLGPQQVASELGLGETRVPLGIAITREPDWRMIAGGSQLFAVSGKVWNPTDRVQDVPDIRAELRDARGRIVYRWTITRPTGRLGPHASIAFDGAAVDVPPSSRRVSVAFATGGGR